MKTLFEQFVGEDSWMDEFTTHLFRIMSNERSDNLDIEGSDLFEWDMVWQADYEDAPAYASLRLIDYNKSIDTDIRMYVSRHGDRIGIHVWKRGWEYGFDKEYPGGWRYGPDEEHPGTWNQTAYESPVLKIPASLTGLDPGTAAREVYGMRRFQLMMKDAESFLIGHST